MSTNDDSTLHHNFDYKNTKRVFHQEVGFVLHRCKLNNKLVIYKESIERVISDFEDDGRGHNFFFGIEYNIANENGRNILCNIERSTKAPYEMISFKRILSIEEIFDVITEIHLCGPLLSLVDFIDQFSNCNILPCFTEMHVTEPPPHSQANFDSLPKNEIIPSLIKLLWKVCDCYNNKIEVRNGLILDQWFKTVGEMGIIETAYSDKDVCRILVYVEKNTNFVLLRPLETGNPEEVANELLSIFCDFGPPQHLDSDWKLFFYRVLKIFESQSLPFQLPRLYTRSNTHKIDIMKYKVRHMLRDWMDKSKSDNWVIGTHVVQWMLNTMEVLDTYIRSKIVHGPSESPYHARFGTLPHTDRVLFKSDKSMKEVEQEFSLCSQCHQQVHKKYKCNFCQAICHFMCCQRVVEVVNGILIFINKCNSCYNNMPEEVVLGV